MKQVNRVMAVVERICLTIASGLLIFICLSIAAQVVVRKLGGTMVWVDEMTRFAFIYLVLLGTVDLARKGGHISITSFLDMLPAGARKVADLVIYLAVTGFSGLMVYSYFMAAGKYEGVYFSVVKWIPMTGHYLLVAVLMALITLESILHIIDLVQGGK